MKIWFTIVILLLLFSSTFASKILFLFPTPSKSHMIVVHALSTALAEKGHQVTVVTPFPLEKELKNHREITVPISVEARDKKDESIDKTPNKFLQTFKLAIDAHTKQAEKVFAPEIYTKILEQKFDLIVIGVSVMNMLLGFAEILDCPVIVLSVQRHCSLTNLMVGNSWSINAVPVYSNANKEMRFVDRVGNFWSLGIDLMIYGYAYYKQKELYE